MDEISLLILQPECAAPIRALVRRLAQIEASFQDLIAGQVDSILVPEGPASRDNGEGFKRVA